MAISSTVSVRPGLLAHLRSATADAHASLDNQFSTLPLTDAEGYRRFLAGHAIGWAPLWPQFRDFVGDALALPVPDYPAMLTADLADLGTAAADLPRLPDSLAECPAAATYVLAGSRMGIAMIRRQPSFASEHGRAGRYMADASGPDLFRALRDWMDGPDSAAVDRDAAVRGALDAFAVFAAAFDLSERGPIPVGAPAV